MKLLDITQENLKQIEENILNVSKKDFKKIYLDMDYLFKVMETTKNKNVFIRCMHYVPIPFLIKKLEDKELNQEMLFKLTLHPHSCVQSAILKREDVTAELLKQMINNFVDKELVSTRYSIINHKKMDENTLYELCECNNNQIQSQILLTNIVSNRIIKKLQKSSDTEISIMAKVRDPETDPGYIKKIIKKEFKNTIKTKGEYLKKYEIWKESYLLNDTLEAAIRNPALPTELVELYKKSNKTVLFSLVIPHPNISKELLDFFYKEGDEDIKEAVLKRNKNEETHHL